MDDDSTSDPSQPQDEDRGIIRAFISPNIDIIRHGNTELVLRVVATVSILIGILSCLLSFLVFIEMSNSFFYAIFK